MLYTLAGPPVIPEDSLFEPSLDLLAEQPLDLTSHGVPASQQSVVASDDVATLAQDRGRWVDSPTDAVGHAEDDVA